MKRVLVTGGGGFIGRRTLAPLLERGFDVHVVDIADAAPAGAPPGVRWVKHDLLAAGGAAAALAEVRPSHLLHLAWYAAHGLFWTSPENLRWVAASLELVRAFREQGGERAVLAGSCAEYDWASGWCAEATTPLRPHTLYGTSKDALRRVVEAYASSSGLSWAWGRVFFLFGPDEHPDRLVASVARSVVRGEPTSCTHGRQVRDFLHVDDVAAAFAAVLDTPELQGPVNVASGEPRTLRDVVTAVARAAGAPELARFGDRPAPSDDPPFLVADVRRLRDEARFEPRRSLEDGVAEVVASWRAASAGSTPGPANP